MTTINGENKGNIIETNDARRTAYKERIIK